jgi:hypothetical protein
LTVGTTGTTGGAAGQLMFDTGSALSESPNLVFASNTLTIGKASTAAGALTLIGTSGTGSSTLTSEAADTLTLVNAANAQTLNIYRTWTSAGANYERLQITTNWNDYLGNPCLAFQTQKNGTGVARNLVIGAGGTDLHIRGAVVLPDANQIQSNLYYNSGYKNHAASAAGWLLKISSNIISFYGSTLQGSADAATSLTYPWTADVGNSYYGVWQNSPAYALDVTGVVNSTVGYKVAGTTLLSGQSTGYGTPTGGAKQASFAAGSITLANLAACVAQLIIDLKAGLHPAT